MASLKFALLLFVCLEGCALTSSSGAKGLQNVPDALTANGDVCKDCTQIFELLADIVSNPDLQKKITDGIEKLCVHLPGAAAKICKDEVEKMLPLTVHFLTAVVKPAEVCKIIGLCGSSCARQEEMLRYFAKEALQVAVTSNNMQPDMQCSLCIFIFKTIEELLPKERTEGAVVELLEEVCQLLPSSFKGECETVIEKFGKTVLDALLSYATPQAICALIHMCKGQEVPFVDASLTDPCTVSTHRCRDIKTALQCGTLFYCQRFAWKPLNSAPLNLV